MLKRKLSKIKLLFLPCKENNYRPRLLESDFLFYYFLFLLVLRIVILPFYIYFPRNIFFAEVVSTTLTDLLNKERESLGLSALRENPQLSKAALLKAQDMLENDYFAHRSPEGITGWYWIKKAGYNYQRAGENLAIAFLDSEEVHKAWNDSSLHKQNLLDSHFQDIGTAVLKGDFQGRETTVVVQLFGSPKLEKVLKEEIIPPAEAAELEIPKEEEEVITEEEIAGEIKEPLVLKEEEKPKEEELKEQIDSLQFNFLGFMTTKYNQVVQNIIFYSLILVSIVLISEIFVLMVLFFQGKLALKPLLNLIPRTLFFLGLFVLLIFFDKQVALSLIPHDLRIYGI